MQTIESLEGRDRWWALWRALTSDAALGAVCALALVGLLAWVALPQRPADAAADPVAYSRWEATARSQQGALFAPLNSLGLNAVAQSAWWRLALAALIPLAGLRLADRLARWMATQRQDEPRLRVMLDAPPLAQLAAQLRAQGYRVAQPTDDLLMASDAPRALAFACAFHGGLILAASGLLLNLVLGWEVASRTVTANGPARLAGGLALTLRASDDPASVVAVLQPGDQAVMLSPGQTAQAANGVALTLNQMLPGYRLRAFDSSGAALPIQVSNFRSPSAEALITMDEPERYLAIPEARLALALRAEGTGGRLRAYAIPSGQLMYEGDIRAEVMIGQTTLRFQPAASAVISARYRPGDWLWPLGAALAAIGAIGSALFPIRRIVIQRRGEWTEFYAAGRRVRAVIASLVSTQRT
jgi:hypothetical protein